MSHQSNFEQIVGEAIANPTFAKELENAATKIQKDRRNTQPLIDAIENNANLGFTLEGDELKKMVDVIPNVNFKSISKVAKAFGDEKGPPN